MPYFLNTADDQRAMLETIGAASLEELFAMVPADLRLGRDLKLPPAMGEMELTAHLGALAAQNQPAGESLSFLGGGCYDHFIPAVVDFVASRSEFYTSYTPYQPEVSQGNLQALFEYQTLVTQLTGMEISNSSLYDGGSAAAEAILMALALTRRSKVVVAASVHPEYRQILATYLANTGATLVTVGTPGGWLPPEALEQAIDDDTACVLVQHPNFFGCLEEVDELSQITHRGGASFITSVDPISLGLLKRPIDYGADIVVAEGQPLGIPMGFGGPYLGMMACREEFLRRMPGRLVGQTLDHHGHRCWALTLQTREQHIRREKATSNICTNQALLALRATVYLSAMGPAGLRKVAELCLQKSRYALDRLTASGRLAPAFNRPSFREFVVRLPAGRMADLLAAARSEGIFAGMPMECWYPELSDCLLVAVTEKRTKTEIDRLAAVLDKA